MSEQENPTFPLTEHEATAEYAYGRKTNHGWEKILERDGLNSKYLNTRLFLDAAVGLGPKDGKKIQNLDDYLGQQVQEKIDEEDAELATQGLDEAVMADKLEELQKEWTEPLSEAEIHAYIQEIIEKSENTSKTPGPLPKLRQNYEDLERAVVNILRNRERAQAENVDYPDLDVAPDDGRRSWQKAFVGYKDPETGKLTRIYTGSYFGLESTLSFINNPESGLAEHVYPEARSKRGNRRQGYVLDELQNIRLRQKFKDFNRFLQLQFKNYKQQADNAPNLPEEAVNEADAIRPLSEQEVRQWFLKKYEEFEQDAGVFNQDLTDQQREAGRLEAEAHYKAAGYDKLFDVLFPEQAAPKAATSQLSEDEPQDSQSTIADLPVYKAAPTMNVSGRGTVPYQDPPASWHDVEVPDNVAKEFGYKDSSLKREQRAFRPEIGANVRDLQYVLSRDGKLKVFYKADFNKDGTLREEPKSMYINLPTEALIVYKTNPESIQEVVLELLNTNEGSPYPGLFYNFQADKLEIGIGDNVIQSLSPKEIREMLPSLAGELNDYLSRRQASRLSFEERQKMWDFENPLLATSTTNSNGQRLSLKQKIWDEAFRKHWIAKIGDEKFAELVVERAAQPAAEQRPVVQTRRTDSAYDRGSAGLRTTRHPDRNSRKIEENVGRETASSEGGAKFLERVQNEFGGDYVKFFMSRKMYDFAMDAGLNSTQTLNLLAEKILLEEGREKDYQEFQEFAELPRDSQAEFLRENDFDIGGEVTSGLLTARLLMFLDASQEVIHNFRGRTKREAREAREARERIRGQFVRTTDINEAREATDDSFQEFMELRRQGIGRGLPSLTAEDSDAIAEAVFGKGY